MKNLFPILLAACFGVTFSFSAQAKPDSVATGKTRLGATLKGVKLGRDWSRR